ncbi:uncharacterized protein STEHIDRAFT_168960 [Stereum hirsutum FP-91666 SS1]|uniref:uncharacterized protein n=1 Tax=Stereum hirsutum (strain FP-91666) TaxID=721885 RepID=UPI00044493CF|nr:uncharacterized protein STEHIDRAFT_168960 [Stereum hirsutum FP-91666 SS1]EIM85928.1 hypothetical protein STEHIDRAFT_168960 [Stereum hirsutum FP-91666 SS1]
MTSDLARSDFWRGLRDTRIPPIFNNNEKSQSIIQTCDDEIALAHAYIQDISARRNTQLLITQLPSELLASIFSHLLPVITLESYQDQTYGGITHDITSATLSLIAASHVCRSWREVALEHPGLWTTLWMGNKSWMHEMIDRSKNMALTIVQRPGWNYDHRRLREPLTEMSPLKNLDFITHHIFLDKQPRHLILDILTTDYSQKVEGLLRRAAPCLDTLVLHITPALPSDAPLHLPEDLLGRCSPSLRNLTIRGPLTHETLWTSPILRGLVDLTLITQPHGSASIPNSTTSLSDTLEALRNMHQLETLTLGFPFTNRNSPQRAYFLKDTMHDTTRVHLPRLSVLHLSGNLNDTILLTRHLSIPSTAIMKYLLDLRGEEHQARWADGISTLVFPAAPLKPVETIELSFFSSSVGCLHINCWDKEERDEQRPRLALQLFVVAQQAGPQPLPTPGTSNADIKTLVHSLDAVLPNLDLSRLTELRWIRTLRSFPLPMSPLSIAACAEILNKFQTVEKLRFDGFIGHREKLGALASSAVLPRLTSIHFIGVRPMKDTVTLGHLQPQVDLSQELQSVATALRLVAQAHNLQTLVFRRCQISNEHASMFEGIAPNILIG